MGKLKRLFERRIMFGSVMLFMCFAVHATVVSAQTPELNFSRVPLTTVLKEIQKQTPYRFVYNNSLIDVGKEVSIVSSNEDIETVMKKLLAGTGIVHRIIDKQVTLSPATFVQSSTASQPTSVQSAIGARNTVSGTVVDASTGEAVIGAVVSLKGTRRATVTDVFGGFKLDAPGDGIIEVSCLGMLPVEMNIAGRTNIPVVMQQDAMKLQDVVVTGYQTLSRERSTGSFSVIKSENLEAKLQPNMKSVLEGQATGMVVTKEGNIEIRGVSTINGVKDPLIVVDGYPLMGGELLKTVSRSTMDRDVLSNMGMTLESINPDNIETITLLKDAVAASIYGAKASNGVIVITTKGMKGGSPGTFNISYKGTYGVKLKPQLSKLNIASVSDYMDAELDLYKLDPNSYYSTYNSYGRISDYAYLLMAKDRGLISAAEADSKIEALKKNNALKQIEDKLLRPVQSQQHNISLSSVAKGNAFNAMMRYFRESGDLLAKNSSRLTVDIGDTWSPKDWLSVKLLLNVNNQNSKTPIANLSSLTTFGSSSWILPYSQLYDDSGNPTSWAPVGQSRLSKYETYPGMKSVLYHPADDLRQRYTDANELYIRMGGDINLNFCKFLKGSVGGTWTRSAYGSKTIWEAESFSMRTAYNDATSAKDPTVHYVPEGGKIDENRGTATSWLLRYQLNYSQAFGGEMHRVTAMFGGEVNRDTYEISYLPTRLGYNPVSATYNSGFNPYDFNNNTGGIRGNMLFALAPTNLGTIGYGSNYGVRDNRFASWYANASYEFNNKYLVTGSTRLDLTNFFGTDPKYRYKPAWSVGGKYKLAEESFFEGLKSVFGRFDIRASYGVTGNISLSYTPYLVLSVGSHNTTTGGISYAISTYPNNQLRWEKTKTIDLGADFSVLNDKLNVTVEYYNKKSKDLIVSDAIDETRGTTAVPMNVGSVTNKGIEVNLSGSVLKGKDFSWWTNLNISHNTSMVDYYKVNRMYFTSFASANGILVEGYPMDGFWGAKFAGLNDKGVSLYYNKAGDKVEGGSLKAEDAVYLGTLRPKVDIGFTNSFRYRNFEASIMFIGKFGHKYRKDNFSGSNYINRHVGERWKKPGDEANTIYPVIQSWNMDMFYYPYSDVLVGNASYVKLRDVTLTYNIPAKAAKAVWLSGAKVYFQTRNLFCITAKGVDIDPETAEVNTTGGTGAMTNQGYVSMQLRPEFYFGLSVTF